MTTQRKSAYPTTRAAAFTLIELLTVIAIIGILAAIIIPVTGQVRKKSRDIRCVANLRECGNALLLRANENRGQLNMTSGGSGGGASVWARYVAGKVLNISDSDNVIVTQANLALDILYCPSATPFRFDPSVEGFNWSWHTYGGYFVDTDDAKRVSVDARSEYRLNLNRVTSPSSRPLLMDSIQASSGRQQMNILSHTANAGAGSVHLRHGNRANVLFVDGHVAGQDPQALKNLGFVSGFDESLKMVTF